MSRFILLISFLTTIGFAQEAKKLGNRANQDLDICKNLGGGSESCATIDGPTGNLGLNKPAPTSKFHLKSNSKDEIVALFESTVAGEPTDHPQQFGIHLDEYQSHATAARTKVEFRLSDSNVTTPDTTVMTLLSNGNAGLGTTNPLHPLHIEGADLKGLQIGAVGGQDIFLFGDNSFGSVIASNVNLGFSANSGTTKHMTLSTTGNFGLGTTNPQARVHSFSPGGSGNPAFIIEADASLSSAFDGDWTMFVSNFDGGDTGSLFWDPSNSNAKWALRNSAGATRFLVDTENGDVSGTHGTYHTASDARLKEDFQPITNAIDKVSQLNGVTYTWKDKSNFGEQRFGGLLAQDVEKVFPEAVHSQDDELKIKAIMHDQLSGLYVEAIKELKRELDSLRSELKSLKEQHEGF